MFKGGRRKQRGGRDERETVSSRRSHQKEESSDEGDDSSSGNYSTSSLNSSYDSEEDTLISHDSEEEEEWTAYDDDDDDRTDIAGMFEQSFLPHKIDDADSSVNESYYGSDDDHDSADRRLNKMCYQLATNDINLTRLDLEVRAVGSMAKDIAKHLPHNKRVTLLYLTCGTSSSAKNPPDEKEQRILKMLVSGLGQNASVLDLQFQGVRLNRDVASYLGAGLAENQSVQKVCLKDCHFLDESALAVLFLGMQHNQKIQELSILSSKLTTRNCDIVAASLLYMNLQSLVLVDTQLDLEGLRFLCDNIAKASHLTQLNLSRTKLGMSGVALLASSLQSPQQKVEKLILADCSLDDSCIHKLVKGLSHKMRKSSLTNLQLSRNDLLTDAGAVHLKRLLERNNHIQELSVDGCRGISKTRRKLIADGLRYNRSFLKSIFAESTTLAILESVDLIESLGSGGRPRLVSP